MDKETRSLLFPVELRESEEGSRILTGYAVKWEELSQKLGYYYRFQEKFSKNAFMDSLKDDDQRALWNHNTDIVLGRTKNGTLKLEEDDIGLRFDIDLPKTSWGSDVYESVKRGDVDGVSFGFRMAVEEWDESDPDNIIRTIKKAQLYEVSPTVFPAYEGSSEVSTRSAEDSYKKFKEAIPDGEKSEDIEQRNYVRELRKKIAAY